MHPIIPLPPQFALELSRRPYAPPPSVAPEAAGAPVDIGRMFNAVRRRWWLVALLALAGACGAWYLARHRPRVYAATAVVQLTNSRAALTGDAVNGGAQANDDDAMLSQIEILQSRAVAGAVVDSEPLLLRLTTSGVPRTLISDVQVVPTLASARIPLVFTPIGVRVGQSPDVVPYGMPVRVGGLQFAVKRRPAEPTGVVAVLSRERAIDRLLIGLDASPRKGTNVLEIRYASDNPTTARAVVNRVAVVYQAVNARMAQEQLHRRRVFIQDQLQRVDAQLTDADRALSTFRNQQLAYSSQEKFKVQENALAQLDVHRQDLEGDWRMSASLLADLESGSPEARRSALRMVAASPELGQSPMISDLYRQLAEYERSRVELTSGPNGYTDQHPAVQRFDSLIVDTRRQIVSSVQAHVAVLNSRIHAIDELRTQNAAALQQVPAAAVEESRLEQNAEALRQQDALLRQDHQRAQIDEAAETGQVDIVDLASRAYSAPSPVFRVTLFGLFLGLLAGGGAAILLNAIDRTVQGRTDLEGSLRLPVLATIPLITSVGAKHGRVRSEAWRGRKRPPALEQRRSVALASSLQSRSPGAEAFRQLRTNLAYHPGEPVRRILVTSPTEGDGKTSVAVNLAVSLAQQHQRVLLIDCDLYGAKLHRIFHYSTSPGFCEVVLGIAPPAEAFRETDIPGLTVMTVGGAPESTRDVLGTDRTGAVLAELSAAFDVVVLDCSPILALTDSMALSASADAVLLVVRAGHTETGATSEAVRHLSTVGARVAGAVLNDPEERTREAGSYYYYGYQYGSH